jgi:adenine/guanine phosphoribosyltransferase-like PRPP-binding protein
MIHPLVYGETMQSPPDVLLKYKKTTRKHFMSLEESILLSQKIGAMLGDSDNMKRPDLILGIANGALLMTKVISDQLSVPCQMIKICRSGTQTKEFLARSGIILAIASLWYRTPMLNRPLKFVMHRLEKLVPCHDSGSNLAVKDKTVALVDDCIESGQTLHAARQLLENAGAGTIEIGVISWSDRLDSRQMHGIIPDAYINKRIQHYPWSRNSPHRKAYMNWLAANGLEEWR